MKRTTILLSDSDHDQPTANWLQTLGIFMPIITAVEEQLIPFLRDSDRLIWEVKTLGCIDAGGKATIQVMRRNDGSFFGVNSFVDGTLEGESGYLVLTGFGPLYHSRDKKHLYFSSEKKPETVDTAIKFAVETLHERLCKLFQPQ